MVYFRSLAFLCLAFLTTNLVATNGLFGQSRYQRNGQDAYERYAEGLLKTYDKNKDGYLNKSEIEEMRRPPKNADKNRDGRVSREELIESLIGKNSGRKPRTSVSDKDVSSQHSPAKTNLKEPIGVRINLFQFESGEQLSMAKQLASELEEAKDITKFIDAIADLDEVIITDELFFNLPVGRLLKFDSSSESRHDLFSVKASLIDADPQIKCNLDIQKTISKERANSQDAKMQKIKDDIEQAIREQLHQRGVSRAAIPNRFNEQSETWHLRIETSIHCERGTAAAKIFKHDGRLWLLVATFDDQ